MDPQIAPIYWQVFQKMDADNSGTLDKSELKDALKDEEIQKYLQVTLTLTCFTLLRVYRDYV